MDVPTHLSREAKEALKAYDALTGNTLAASEESAEPEEKETKKKKKGFFK